MTGNDADASDATQEALISLVRGLPRFDGRSQFATWAYRIAVNAALDELRRRRRRPDLGLDASRPPAAHRAGAEEAEASAERIDVDAALLRLPVEFRAPVVLRDLCGLDYAEIADVLDLPAGTVRSRIARGRAALVPMLGEVPPRTSGHIPGPDGTVINQRTQRVSANVAVDTPPGGNPSALAHRRTPGP